MTVDNVDSGVKSVKIFGGASVAHIKQEKMSALYMGDKLRSLVHFRSF